MKQIFHQIVIFTGVFLFLGFINGPSNPAKSQQQQRNVASEVASKMASLAEETKSSSSTSATSESSSNIDTSTCQISPVQVPTTKLDDPIFLPSYPGSGTKLQWEIVEALTGIPTTDDAFSNGHHNVVAIKTHYPCMAGRTFPGAEEIPKAILFLRHPMDALPEYFNRIHASEQNVPYDVDKLPLAPLKAWKEWRDQAFSRELETWRKHMEYWLDRYSDGFSRLVVAYEQFLSEDLGPQLSLQIAEFLSRSEGVDVIAAQDVPCVWKIIVDKYLENKKQVEDDLINSATMEAGGENDEQEEHDDSQVVITEQEEEEEMEQDDNELDRRHLRRRRLQMSMSNTQKTPYQMILEHQRMEQQQQQQPSSNMMEQQQQQQMMLDQQQQQVTTTSMDQQQQQVVVDDNNGAGSDNPMMMMVPEQQQGGVVVEQQEQQGSDPFVDFSQMSARPPSEDDEEEEYDDEEDDYEEDEDSPSWDSDEDADPLSRPYTNDQRREIISVLTTLLEKYGKDKVVTPVMVQYIDEVERRATSNRQRRTRQRRRR